MKIAQFNFCDSIENEYSITIDDNNGHNTLLSITILNYKRVKSLPAYSTKIMIGEYVLIDDQIKWSTNYALSALDIKPSEECVNYCNRVIKNFHFS